MVKQRKAKEEFKQLESYKPQNKKEEALLKALVSIGNEDVMVSFIRDLMTPAEIGEFSNRLEIARMLLNGHSYQEVADKTQVSTTTVTRVAHWLFNGCGGYYNVLNKIKTNL